MKIMMMTSDWTVSHCSLRCSQSSLNKLDKLKLSCQDLKKYKKKKREKKKVFHATLFQLFFIHTASIYALEIYASKSLFNCKK
jgi:hypothetical protein